MRNPRHLINILYLIIPSGWCGVYLKYFTLCKIVDFFLLNVGKIHDYLGTLSALSGAA